MTDEEFERRAAEETPCWLMDEARRARKSEARLSAAVDEFSRQLVAASRTFLALETEHDEALARVRVLREAMKWAQSWAARIPYQIETSAGVLVQMLDRALAATEPKEKTK